MNNNFYSKAFYILNHCKTVFVFVISTFIVINGTAAVSSLTSSSGPNWLLGDNQYNLAAFDQRNGTRDSAHASPLPSWSNYTKNPLILANIQQYKDLIRSLEPVLQRMLDDTQYNGIQNFIDFYKAFKGKSKNFAEFYKSYDIPINRRDHNCVTLSMELIYRLCLKRPDLNDKLYLVSSKYDIYDIDDYISNFKRDFDKVSFKLTKEHVIVALRIKIAGRDGIILFDSSNSIAHAITVMKDKNIPHNGWFAQEQDEYHYKYNDVNDDFIEGIERKVNTVATEISLTYIKSSYSTAVDVSLRRNLINKFQAFFARNGSGHVIACICFFINGEDADNEEFTLFYDGPNKEKFSTKIKFNLFKDVNKIPKDTVKYLNDFVKQTRFTQRSLYDLLKTVYEILSDDVYIKQMLSIFLTFT